MSPSDQDPAIAGNLHPMRSMTGYADAAGAIEGWTWTMDLRAVNGRGLDLRLRAPDWVEGFEAAARKKLQAALSRGNVTLNVRITREDGNAATQLDTAALGRVLETIAQIETAAAGQGSELRRTSAADIMAMRGVLDARDDQGDTKALTRDMTSALDDLIARFDANRAAEGQALHGVLTERLAEVERLTKAARDLTGERGAQQRAALDAALARLLDATEVPDEARLIQEMAVIAVKTDISEEIDRLAAHVDAARALLDAKGPVGRKFDFLMQEFNREANTLCSKSQSTELTQVGLDLKTVIDQMREQVQNIE